MLVADLVGRHGFHVRVLSQLFGTNKSTLFRDPKFGFHAVSVGVMLHPLLEALRHFRTYLLTLRPSPIVKRQLFERLVVQQVRAKLDDKSMDRMPRPDVGSEVFAFGGRWFPPVNVHPHRKPPFRSRFPCGTVRVLYPSLRQIVESRMRRIKRREVRLWQILANVCRKTWPAISLWTRPASTAMPAGRSPPPSSARPPKRPSSRPSRFRARIDGKRCGRYSPALRGPSAASATRT